MRELKRRFGNILLIVLALPPGFVLGWTASQQVADPDFKARVVRPAYTTEHPKVLFDEAHFNFHTIDGRYRPFAELITSDGYDVTPNKQKFAAGTLKGFQLLVIANALGAERQNSPDAGQSAFSDSECNAVRDWVKSGGSLLLIADHAPFGSAADSMAKRFDVSMSKGTTIDPAHHAADGNAGFLIFSRDNGLLADHPITRGRDQSERIDNVMSFTGQSLKGPDGSFAFLKLADSAMDRQPPSKDAPPVKLDRFPDGRPLPADMNVYSRAPGPEVSAAGRAQGIAFAYGNGRVVVLGEAAMLSAQIIKGQAAQMMGKDVIQMGMNRPGIDNKQLALNIVHWLSVLIK